MQEKYNHPTFINEETEVLDVKGLAKVSVSKVRD